MSQTATEPRAVSMPALAAALAVIALLAIGLPYWLVSTLHMRRLQAADRALGTIATALRATGGHSTGGVLIGAGERPRASDTRWDAAPAAPLTDAGGKRIPADPWGNGYVVLFAREGTWILSAGPDGVLQTAFPPASATAARDDRIRLIK